jgi:chaperone required for assembly of F1-ATPase
MMPDDDKPIIGATHEFAASGAPKGPITDTMKKPRIKRFYKVASVSSSAPFQILLDGRAVKTPAKRPFVLPTLESAEAVASEWAAQSAEIHPGTMPMTRFANTAIDAVATTMADVAGDIVAYAGRDLLCYRAEAPATLVHAQAAKWNPVVDWAAKSFDAPFTVVNGIMPVDQPAQALNAIAAALQPHETFRLTALHVMTTLTGSALLAVAHAQGFISADDAWAAAHVDEDYQRALWGEDDEATARRVGRTAEFHAASQFLQLINR